MYENLAWCEAELDEKCLKQSTRGAEGSGNIENIRDNSIKFVFSKNAVHKYSEIAKKVQFAYEKFSKKPKKSQ